MSLRDLQLLFSDLTLRRIDIDTLELIETVNQARSLGYSLRDDEIKLLRQIDWQVARRSLHTHRHLTDVLSRARYLHDPDTGRFVRVQYPYPNPRLFEEETMPDKKKQSQESTANQPQLGNVDQPVQFPPQTSPQDSSAFQAAAVRCAPAVDPSMFWAAMQAGIDPSAFQPAAVRCAPAVDPNLFWAAMRAGIDPSAFQPAAVRCAPAVDPNMFWAAMRAGIDPSAFQPAAVRCAPAVDPSLFRSVGQLAQTVPVPPSVQLRGAVLKGANLSNQDLRGADLVGADLTEADLTNSDLRGANLAGAILQGAKLSGVKWK